MKERIGVLLQETGKICITTGSPDYAFENSEGVLMWANNGKDEPVRLDLITGALWQPYHEVKEIRPEKAGELWENGDGKYYHTHDVEGDLYLVGMYEAVKVEGAITSGMTRLYPPVENVERIEIESVKFASLPDSKHFAYPMVSNGGTYNWKDLPYKPAMKMILEIPKEDS